MYKDVLPAPELHVRGGPAAFGTRHPPPAPYPLPLLPPPQELISEYCAGPLLALEVSGEGAVARLRELAGPRDPEVARMVRCVAQLQQAGRAAAAKASHHALVHSLPAHAPHPLPLACRPSTLRARFGATPARPGLHVTDLPEDGPLECEYMFGILESLL